VLHLASHAPALALGYLRAALALCRWWNIAPSYVLHPLDFMGAEDAPALSFLPGMALPGARKRALLDTILGRLARDFEVVPLGIQAKMLAAGPALAARPLALVS
jgi:hypothetical protein